MKISINPSIFEKNFDVKIGIIHYTKITVDESPQMIKGRFRLFQEHLFIELQDSSVTSRPGINEWRKLWKAYGADPNRYRNSSESLMRRIAKQNYLTPFHLAVDLNNFFSIQYEIPIGIYDLNKIVGDVEITLGNEQTGYEGLNGRFNTLKNILCSKDEKGAFGSPFVDSLRTSVTEETTEALHIFYLRPSLETKECKKLLESAGNMFNQIAGGEYETAVLTNENPKMTLEVKK